MPISSPWVTSGTTSATPASRSSRRAGESGRGRAARPDRARTGGRPAAGRWRRCPPGGPISAAVRLATGRRRPPVAQESAARAGAVVGTMRSMPCQISTPSSSDNRYEPSVPRQTRTLRRPQSPCTVPPWPLDSTSSCSARCESRSTGRRSWWTRARPRPCWPTLRSAAGRSAARRWRPCSGPSQTKPAHTGRSGGPYRFSRPPSTESDWRSAAARSPFGRRSSRLTCGASTEPSTESVATTTAPTGPCAACLDTLEQAVALDRGEFMAGFAVRSSEFDAWQADEADAYRRELTGALERLARGRAAMDAWAAAIRAAQRWLELDGLHEPAHVVLMSALAAAGEPSAALQQYRECVRILDSELGVAPLAETTALAEAIRDGRFAPAASARRRPDDHWDRVPPRLRNRLRRGRVHSWAGRRSSPHCSRATRPSDPMAGSCSSRVKPGSGRPVWAPTWPSTSRDRVGRS